MGSKSPASFLIHPLPSSSGFGASNNDAQINTKDSNLIIYTSFYPEKLDINMMGKKWILVLFCRPHHHQNTQNIGFIPKKAKI